MESERRVEYSCRAGCNLGKDLGASPSEEEESTTRENGNKKTQQKKGNTTENKQPRAYQHVHSNITRRNREQIESQPSRPPRQTTEQYLVQTTGLGGAAANRVSVRK